MRQMFKDWKSDATQSYVEGSYVEGSYVEEFIVHSHINLESRF